MNFTSQVKAIAEQHNLNFGKCEVCGYQSFSVRAATRWKAGTRGNKITYENIIFLCPNCRFDLPEHREEWFGRLRP